MIGKYHFWMKNVILERFLSFDGAVILINVVSASAWIQDYCLKGLSLQQRNSADGCRLPFFFFFFSLQYAISLVRRF